jgi:hypothetical protein
MPQKKTNYSLSPQINQSHIYEGCLFTFWRTGRGMLAHLVSAHFRFFNARSRAKWLWILTAPQSPPLALKLLVSDLGKCFSAVQESSESAQHVLDRIRSEGRPSPTDGRIPSSHETYDSARFWRFEGTCEPRGIPVVLHLPFLW